MHSFIYNTKLTQLYTPLVKFEHAADEAGILYRKFAHPHFSMESLC